MIYEILPCPFCGGPGKITEDLCGVRKLPASVGGAVYVPVIFCLDCGARVYGRDKKEAVGRWNRRAETVPQKPNINGL